MDETLAIKKYWDERYRRGENSGDGSYGEQLQKKLSLLKGLGITSITDVGCGDFNFGKNLLEIYPQAKYTGYDLSSVIIEKNKKNFPKYEFTNYGVLPQADLILCVDVLFHILDDKNYELALQDLDNLWRKYLAVTAYEYDNPEIKGHIKVRKFDYKRFGEPIIREVVEEDGQLYFYLFKRPEAIDLSKVSCCLNTKEATYPKEILAHVSQFPFGEILIKTHSESPYCKHELFAKAKYDLIYCQDDDAICPIKELVEQSKPEMINVAMTQHHFDCYKDRRMTMGLGWGSIFPKSVLSALKKYTDKYGEDDLFKRDTEKILTQLVYPQNRLVLPITDLPSATHLDRLYRQPEHYPNMTLIEEKCKELV
jgi:hypothetical protein